MPYRYPILLDLSARSILIVGGGRVALRKALGLIDAGARHIKCVAPQIDPEMPLSVQKITTLYRTEHLDGMDLVFAATNSPTLNSRIVQDARQRGIWACRVDAGAGEPGDFVTPAKWTCGPVTIAISAGSPALAAAIRDNLSQCLDERWIKLAEALQVLRPLVIQAPDLSPERRSAALRELAGNRAVQVLEEGGIEALHIWIKERYPELNVP